MKRSIDKNQLFVLFISKQQEEIFVHVMEKIGGITTLYNKQDIIIIHTDDHYIEGNYSMVPFLQNSMKLNNSLKEIQNLE